MWAVEAKTFGDNPDFFYTSGLTEAASRKLHTDLANSGEWPYVRSWNTEADREQKEADARIKAYFESLEDGVGEGQPL